MKKTIILLTLVLVAQVGLGIALNMNRQQMAPFRPTALLLGFEPGGVDMITITGADKAGIRLVKKDGRWILPDYYQFPADQEAVSTLLDTLAGLKEGWPVATTRDAAVRFRVAKDDFERHIVLLHDNKPVADLYVGTSPGFRKVHVRVAGSNDILAVRFSAHDAGTGATDWLDRRFLAVDEKKIRKIVLPKFTLVRKDDSLVLTDLGSDETMKKEPVGSLVSRIAGLRIEAVLGNREKPDYRQDKPKLTITVELPDRKRVYTFSQPEKEDWYVLKTSDSDLYFKVAGWQLAPLLDARRELLVRKKEEPKKETAAGRPEAQSPGDPGRSTAGGGSKAGPEGTR